MTDHYRLGDRLEIWPETQFVDRYHADFHTTMSTLRAHGDMETVRGVMVLLNHGNVGGMSDDAIVHDLSRDICTGNYSLQMSIAPPSGGEDAAPPDPKPRVVPAEPEKKNPFAELAARDRMVVRMWGLEIGGGMLAYNLYEDRIRKFKTTADPFVDPEEDRKRRENAEKRVRAAAELEGRSITRRYQRDVIAELTKVRRTKTGAAVFRAVDRAVTKVVIRIDPWTKSSANAAARPAQVFEKHKRDPLDSFPEEIEFRRRQRWPALVLYTPATWKRVEQEIWSELGIVLNEEEGPGSEPEEVLLHELIHALRIAMGITTRRNPVFQRKRYRGSTGRDGLEEFYAILVANIYRSELGRDIRFGHSSFDKSWESVDKFLNTALNRTHIRMLRRRMPILFNELKEIDAPWNPLKEFKDAKD